MKSYALLPTLVLLAASTAMVAQNLPAAGRIPMAGDHQSLLGASQTKRIKTFASSPTPFSRIAVGGGMSLMGLNMQVAVNANRFMNLRATGNYFNYSINNIDENGFNITGKLNFATAGASVDIYPFPNHGFRLSPGALFYNQNNVAANMIVTGGTKLHTERRHILRVNLKPDYRHWKRGPQYNQSCIHDDHRLGQRLFAPRRTLVGSF